MGALKISGVVDYAQSPMASFPEIFKGLFFDPIEPINVCTKFEVRSFTRSWDNNDWSFGWGLQTPKLGEDEAVGVGDGTVRKSVSKFL